jgi:3-oxoacyl-[acyl-carrier protein] reductase
MPPTTSWRRFEDFAVGDHAELQHVLTQADVESFAALTGDTNPLHVDPEFARTTSFRKPVVFGMLSASFISTIIGTKLPGTGSLWTRQTLDFLQPAFVGDTLRVSARVRQRSDALRAIVLDITVTNQHGQQLIAGDAVVKLLEQQGDRAPTSEPVAPARSAGPTRRAAAAAPTDRMTVVITGGAGGIGSAVARALVAAGHAVAVGYNTSTEPALALVDELVRQDGRAIAVRADVSRESDVTSLFRAAGDAFGPVLGLVHAAAMPTLVRPFDALTWSDIQRQIDVQVAGAVHCVKAALPAMVAAEAGSIVFLGSAAADGVPPANQADYVVAKAALQALARSLAVEHGPKGVRVNVVSPGMTSTDMIAHLPEKARMLSKMQTPLRRLAEPADVADAVLFLLSAKARHITGETVRVNGGVVML